MKLLLAILLLCSFGSANGQKVTYDTVRTTFVIKDSCVNTGTYRTIKGFAIIEKIRAKDCDKCLPYMTITGYLDDRRKPIANCRIIHTIN
jgi:hypothetical protein